MLDAKAPLVTDFSRNRDGTAVTLDHCDWEIVTSNWGGRTPDGGDYSGGVIEENVRIDEGGLVLKANGNLYEGPLRGRGSDGRLRPDGKRTGAAIRSKRFFRGGRFEACVTIPRELGVVSALWTFRYEEVPGGAPRNHEIDIEFPGQRDAATPVDLDHVNFTTWTGLGENGHTTAFRPLSSRASDGNFHLLRFDWQPPADNTEGQVDFYIDDQLHATITSTVPDLPANCGLAFGFRPFGQVCPTSISRNAREMGARRPSAQIRCAAFQ